MLTKTLTEIIAECRGAVDITSDYISDARLTSLINRSKHSLEALMAGVNETSLPLQEDTLFSLSSATYTLPSACLAVVEVTVTVGGKKVRLHRVSHHNKRDRGVSAEPAAHEYEIWGNTLYLHPATASSSESGSIFYVGYTDDLVTGSNEYDFIGVPALDWLVYDVAMRQISKQEDSIKEFAALREDAERKLKAVLERDYGEPPKCEESRVVTRRFGRTW